MKKIPLLPNTAFEFDDAVGYIENCAIFYAEAFAVPVTHPLVSLTALSAFQYKNALQYDPAITADSDWTNHDKDWVISYRNNMLNEMLLEVFKQFDMANYDLYPKDFWSKYDNVLDWYKEQIAKPLPQTAKRIPRPFSDPKRIDAYLRYIRQCWKQLQDCLKWLLILSKEVNQREQNSLPELTNGGIIDGTTQLIASKDELLVFIVPLQLARTLKSGDPSNWIPPDLPPHLNNAFMKQAERRESLNRALEEDSPPDIGNNTDGIHRAVRATDKPV